MSNQRTRPWYESGDEPDQLEWSWEPHGDGFALMQGRHSRLHGLNRITVRRDGFDADGAAVRELIAALLNAYADAHDRPLIDTLRAALTATEAEAARVTKENTAALHLLAVVHRDGGHRVGEIGFVEATREAIEKVVKLIVLSDEQNPRV